MGFVRVPGNPEPEPAEELIFEGRGGLRLRAMIAKSTRASPPLGSVILCPGRTEFIEKYFEVITELQGRGFVVFCLDWRGQGLSDRETGNRLKGHMQSIDDAVADLFTAMRLYADRLPRPHVILAHSMGGAIALRGLQSNKISADAAFFSAPMWGIKSLKDLAVQVARGLSAMGLGDKFAAGVETKWKRENFKKNVVTHDKERFARAQGLIQTEPKLALAGPTWGWVAAASDAIEQLHQPGSLAHLRMPIVVLSASEDALVDNAAHALLAKGMPNATHQVIAGAKHELLMETDAIRAQVWQAFDAMITRMGPGAPASVVAVVPTNSAS